MRLATDERRQHRRYKLDNSVSLSSQGIFQVTDISRGGFCFRCPPFTPVTDTWDTDILTSAVSLEDFPARRVWISMKENSTHEYLPTIVGVKFGKLSKKQESLLLQLLDNLENNSSTSH
ncbi:MAG: PilZ domain-containing protein [Desulfobacterales bacterium]|nr:PilZ domain-containing protein [Desulfofustis sp.]NNK95352.1 PilZ domain-containing protein [Desulfobacterales bacterium]